MIDDYLPGVVFNNEDPYLFIQDFLESQIIPRSILSGKASFDIRNIFLKQQRLVTLHSVFDKEDFCNILYDSDLRCKLDGMALTPIFRKIDIITEFEKYNPICIEAYLDCFANWKEVVNKNSFICNYIGDKHQRKLYENILKNNSRQYLRMALNIKLPDVSPLDIINHSLHIANFKMQNALLEDNSQELDRWIKLSVMISEKLQRIGAGSKRDVDELIEILQTEAIYEEPKIYSREELESKYQEANKA